MNRRTLHEKERSLNSVRIECREAVDLGSESAIWDSLVTDAGLPPFLRTDFLLPAMEHLGKPRGKLVLGWRGDAPVMAAVLERLGSGRWQSWQPSQLPLGACLLARDCNWSDFVPAVLRALPGVGLELSLTQLDPHFMPRGAPGTAVEYLDYVSTGWIDVAGSFEDFWNARGKNLRQNLGKQRRRLEEQGARLRFEYLDAPADVRSAFEDFARLESAGWKAEAGSAITPDNAQGRFYRDMLDRFARKASAFALRLSLDGKPLAVDFGIHEAGIATILKTTYDEAFKSSSPAQLLHQSAFEYMFSLPLKKIEFYGKVMEWHTRWTEQSRMLYHMNQYRWPLVRAAKRLARRH